MEEEPLQTTRKTIIADLSLLFSPSQDNSGTIERGEFLNLPQVASNPLATR